MQQIRQTEVVKAAVEYQGVSEPAAGSLKPKRGGGKKGASPPPAKATVQEMIREHVRSRD